MLANRIVTRVHRVSERIRRISRTPLRRGLDYKKSGVDINAGNELVRRIQKLNPDIGGFNGLVPFGASSEVISNPLPLL